MGNAIESLREEVGTLSESDAMQALNYIRDLRKPRLGLSLAELLAGDPAIHVPPGPAVPLPAFEPAIVTGIPASELLIQDRR